MQQKVVLVTGASRGIGKSIALQFAQNNYIVIGTATSDAGASDITSILQLYGQKHIGLCLDVCDDTSVERFFSLVHTEFKQGVSILVNNAGVTEDNLFLRMQEDQWDRVIDTNLRSVFTMTKRVIRDMIKAKWGRVINIGSVVGISGNPGQTNYCAAKAGMIGLSKSLALEVASKNRNITVNTIAPGFIDTDMVRALTPEQKKLILDKIPMGRIGEADDIAAMAYFLAGENAGYITGQTMHVNGGMMMV